MTNSSADFAAGSDATHDPGVHGPVATAPDQVDVVRFVASYFDEDESTAATRLRRRRYGWDVDTQPTNGELLLGPGPLLIDGRSGDYWRTSSSPGDVFGDLGKLGWSELKTRSLFEQWKDQRRGPDGNVFDPMPTVPALDE